MGSVHACLALNIWSKEGMREWCLYFMVDRRERGREPGENRAEGEGENNWEGRNGEREVGDRRGWEERWGGERKRSQRNEPGSQV